MRLSWAISDLSQGWIRVACSAYLPQHETCYRQYWHISDQHAVVADYVGLPHYLIFKVGAICLLVTEEQEVLNATKTGPRHYDVAHLIPNQQFVFDMPNLVKHMNQQQKKCPIQTIKHYCVHDSQWSLLHCYQRFADHIAKALTWFVDWHETVHEREPEW